MSQPLFLVKKEIEIGTLYVDYYYFYLIEILKKRKSDTLHSLSEILRKLFKNLMVGLCSYPLLSTTY